MGMAGSLTLIANPGSASRKYGLYEGEKPRAELHFEFVNQKLACTIAKDGEQHIVNLDFQDMGAAAANIVRLLREYNALIDGENIEQIGLRVVAPSAFFLRDRVFDDEVVAKLHEIQPRAPLHVTATLDELHSLREQFAHLPIVGASDSAFHATKPDYAWNYGLPLEDSDRFEVKRFGYHGLSMAATVRKLEEAGKLPPKLVVCHLGSGASVTAIHGGKSVDTTMGYSPLEGVIMSTRCGSIDPTAVHALKDAFNLDFAGIEVYLNNHSGLLGLGGSADIRELLQREAYDDHRAKLALQTYVFSVQKAIGQMTAALGGADALLFTGTVGERSVPVRERIMARLHYLDFILDEGSNKKCDAPEELTVISRLAHSKPVYVLPADEAAQIVRCVEAAIAA